ATLFLAEQEPTDEGVLGVIPAPLLAILDQAQTQTGAARYTVTLTPDEAAPLAAVVEQELEAAADEEQEGLSAQSPAQAPPSSPSSR
ncbi:hypothetical protein DKP78_21240, partial [Enterococcus faecium]